MNVIVGIDGTEQQLDALALGAQLARVQGGHVTIAHVYPWSRWSVRLGAPNVVTIREDADGLLEAAKAFVGDVPSEVRAVADMSAPRGLHRIAEEEGADVLVVGSSHRGPVGRTLLGSVGDRVVHGAPCAVAVAPRGYAEAEPGMRRIGVAYDGSAEARQALGWAGSFAEAVGASVTVLSVFQPVLPAAGYPVGLPYNWDEIEKPMREECLKHLDEAVNHVPADVEATGLMLEGAPAQAVATAASGVDLLVAGSRGYGPTRAVLLGSVSRSLIHHSPCPLIVIPRGWAEVRADDAQTVAGIAAQD